MSDQSHTVVLAAGWDSVTSMIDSAKTPMMGIGIGILVLIGIWVAVKIGAKGKGKMREALEDVAIWIFAGVVLGLALTAPKIASSVGEDIGNSSNPGSNSTVEGQ